jgi:phage antirepressor YoqD-like protein
MKTLESGLQVISSREIAIVTKKLHQHITHDIREMCEQANIEITSNENSFEVHSQELIVVESTYQAKIGNGAFRPVKEYLLNDMAAETLALGYDVKRRIKVLQLVKEMKAVIEKQAKALQSKPIFALDSTCTITDIVKEYNAKHGVRATSNRKIIKLLRKNIYLKPNHRPYEKWINQGLFSYVLYKPTHSAKQLRITQKGQRVIQYLLNPETQPILRGNELVPVQQAIQLVPPDDGSLLMKDIKNVRENQELLFENQNEIQRYILGLKEGVLTILEVIGRARTGGIKDSQAEKEYIEERIRIAVKALSNL